MDKKRKANRKLSFKKIFSYFAIALSSYFIFQVSLEVYNTFKLKQQLNTKISELSRIEEENKVLTSQQEKLEDPNYVQSYARGNYMLSKEGEQIFYLPSAENNDQD